MKTKSAKKKYRQKWIPQDPLKLVAERIRPVEKQGSWLMDRRLKQSQALASLMRGEAVKAHLSDLMAMQNMSVAMQRLKIGDEYRDITDASSEALINIVNRSKDSGRFLATGPEITALQNLYELQDAQYESSTVGEVQKAYKYASNVYRSNADTKLKFYLGKDFE